MSSGSSADGGPSSSNRALLLLQAAPWDASIASNEVTGSTGLNVVPGQGSELQLNHQTHDQPDIIPAGQIVVTAGSSANQLVTSLLPSSPLPPDQALLAAVAMENSGQPLEAGPLAIVKGTNLRTQNWVFQLYKSVLYVVVEKKTFNALPYSTRSAVAFAGAKLESDPQKFILLRAHPKTQISLFSLSPLSPQPLPLPPPPSLLPRSDPKTFPSSSSSLQR